MILCMPGHSFSLAAPEPSPTQALAYELALEGNHAAAAIEYRRLALSEIQPERRAGYYWAAAYEYGQAKKFDLASRMLDHFDENSQNLTAPALLLRGETAMRSGRTEEAEFYYQSVLNTTSNSATESSPPDLLLKSRMVAGRRLAQTLVARGNIQQAKEILTADPTDTSAVIKALDRYAQRHDKKPWIGGLLGMIPGLGYAYSDEYANGLRSLILNGLFIYAMVDTGQDEEWGAFAAIAFFEVTWYTGSIYGGIDAAHRYNKDRQDECLQAIDQVSGFSADLRQIPIVSLRFNF
jgi:tetratricopeptide (TPR) repeat protein